MKSTFLQNEKYIFGEGERGGVCGDIKKVGGRVGDRLLLFCSGGDVSL